MLRYRKTESEDKNLIADWIQKDEDHRGRLQPEFFIEKDRAECFVVSDNEGPIFFCKMEPVTRLHIQFAPISKRRMAVGVDEFCREIKSASRSKFRELIFDSVYQPLTKFLSRRGFKHGENEWSCRLD